MPNPVTISAAVEGLVDEAVVRRLIACAGGHPGPVYGKNGKLALRERSTGITTRRGTRPGWSWWNSDARCAPLLRQDWLPTPPAPRLCFRVAIRQVEAWLMADAETLASYLGVRRQKIPANPEAVLDAKAEMVNLARVSRRREIRADMVPRQGSGRSVGPAYASRLIEYAKRHWRPEIAAQCADSLRRAIDCLRRLVEQA